MNDKKIKNLLNAIGIPRIIVTLFFVLIVIGAKYYKLDLSSLFTNLLGRVSMNGLLVLAMVPAIRSGIQPNLGLSIGIVGGILGGLIAIELGLVGFPALFVAIGIAIVIGIFNGTLYGLLLNRVKGSEMTVSTYVGFSIIALFNMGWLLLPFKSRVSSFALGKGLRNTIALEKVYEKVLTNSIKIGNIGIGSLLFFLFVCFLVFLFLNSRTGIAMSAAGANEKFAKSGGINEDRTRIIGTIISTVLAAVGIIIYQENFGFIQLYNAPLMMSFSAVAAILIGGATIKTANIIHVIIGVTLFQGIISMGLPVANKILPEGNLSEVMRLIISNGVILYSLTKAKGVAGND